MNVRRGFRYVSRNLAILLVLLFTATAASSIYLSRTLSNTHALINQGGSAVGAALALQNLEINLHAALAAERGYVITGNPTYLEQYDDAVKAIPVQQHILQDSDFAISKKQLNDLNALIDKRLEGMSYLTKVRNEQGLNATLDQVNSIDSQEATTSIQTLISSITDQKIMPLASTLRKTQHSIDVASGVAVAIVMFVLILCLLIVWFFQRAIQHERATESIKNEFLSLASHQLRTPATNVKQHLGLLLEGYLGRLTPKQKEALKTANDNNEVEINIINDLLDVAKLDLNKIRLNKKPANIYRLVKEVVDSYRPTLKERRQTIKFDVLNKKTEVFADTIYLKSVIENILDNASKYSRPRTRITIKITSSTRKVTINIKDQGIGMKRKDMSKLFKKFSRIHNEFSNNIETTGLGLYWVKQIVQLHGGRVSAKSRLAKGSTFTVELPRLQP